MKSNKKFPPALGASVDQALKDKSAWIGKTVQDLTCEAIRKRGLSQEDTEEYVCLTFNEAKEAIADYIDVVAEDIRKRNEPEIKIKHPKSIRLLI